MMKRWIILGCMAMSFASCDKVEHKLEGKWQLKTVEEDGVVHPVDTVWYNFQTSLFGYQFYDPANNLYGYSYGFKDLKGETQLDLEFEWDQCRIYDNSSKKKDIITLDQFLPCTDWKNPKRTFTIDKYSKKELVLSSEGKTYTFEKF